MAALTKALVRQDILEVFNTDHNGEFTGLLAQHQIATSMDRRYRHHGRPLGEGRGGRSSTPVFDAGVSAPQSSWSTGIRARQEKKLAV